MLRSLSWFALFTMFPLHVFAATIELYPEGPIHEAYLCQENGQKVLESTSSIPPTQIEESIPPQIGEDFQWIPGYFSWSEEKKKFIWVSGVWRRPPPGKKWITGKWVQADKSWVWQPGFWASRTERFEFIHEIPPDPIDEKVNHPANENYFWVPGYWNYNPKKKKFVWHSGRYEIFDKTWVFYPAHYVWREEGYIFVPSFWDWPLEKRGKVFSSVLIDADLFENVTYTPKKVLEQNAIIKFGYGVYPYYLCLFHHHYHFHPEFWLSSKAAPPWWGCSSWWSFTWYDQFWLWWWWTHPGYPQPFWISKKIAKKIPPPSSPILNLMQSVAAPPIITAKGVVAPVKLLEAGKKLGYITNSNVLPYESEKLEAIQEAAFQQANILSHPFILKPSEMATNETLTEQAKPSFGPGKEELELPPERAQLCEKPYNVSAFQEKKQIPNNFTPRPRAPVSPGISLRYPYGCEYRYSRKYRPSYIDKTPSDLYYPPSPESNPTQPYYPTSPGSSPGPMQPCYPSSPGVPMQPSSLYGPAPIPPGGVTPIEEPYQGQPKMPYTPPIPFAQQNLGDFMNSPMPQKNQGQTTNEAMKNCESKACVE